MATGGIIAIIAFLIGTGVAIGVPSTIAAHMMLRFRLLSKTVPGFKTRYLGPLPGSLADFTSALSRFIEEWSAEFDKVTSKREVRTQIDGMLVQFIPGEAFMYRDEKVRGVMVTKNLVMVATRNPLLGYGGTALFHELAHAMLAQQKPYFDPDPDHEGPKYKGWTPAVTAIDAVLSQEFRVLAPVKAAAVAAASVARVDDDDVRTCGTCGVT